jgi:hypothetical protein
MSQVQYCRYSGLTYSGRFMETIAAAQNVDRASWPILGRIGIAVFWCAAIVLSPGERAFAGTSDTLHLDVLLARPTAGT